MAHDALGAHACDELGISTTLAAHPIQAALSSAASFSVGAALPLLATFVTPQTFLIPVVALSCDAWGLGRIFTRSKRERGRPTRRILGWPWPWQLPPAQGRSLARLPESGTPPLRQVAAACGNAMRRIERQRCGN